jgi:hypothetical protein
MKILYLLVFLVTFCPLSFADQRLMSVNVDRMPLEAYLRIMAEAGNVNIVSYLDSEILLTARYYQHGQDDLFFDVLKRYGLTSQASGNVVRVYRDGEQPVQSKDKKSYSGPVLNIDATNLSVADIISAIELVTNAKTNNRVEADGLRRVTTMRLIEIEADHLVELLEEEKLPTNSSCDGLGKGGVLIFLDPKDNQSRRFVFHNDRWLEEENLPGDFVPVKCRNSLAATGYAVVYDKNNKMNSRYRFEERNWKLITLK